MPNCKQYEICGLSDEADPKAGLCILHSVDPGKDEHAFTIALKAHRQKSSDFRLFLFPGKTWFHGFLEEANFRGARFTGEASFIGTDFRGKTDFSGTNFRGKADFLGVGFPEEANFREATFTGEADFLVARFTGQADFSRAKFTGVAWFLQATFTGETNFSNAEFTGGTDFSDAEFTGRANFGIATLSGADFSGATFTQGANFSGARFTGEAKFIKAMFSDATSFDMTTFSELADFGGATFTKMAEFFGGRFLAGASFQGTSFTDGKVDFSGCSFQGKTLFTARRAEGLVSPIFAQAEADFTNVIIDPPDALAFVEANLEKCHFLDTDLRQVRLTGVKWPRMHGRYVVYDEQSASKENRALPWPRLETLYRQLKKNYEDQRDYERAGDFHFGEKEMRRQNPETRRGLKLLLNLYRLLSGYGECYLPPLGWAIGLLVVSAVAYLFFGLRIKESGTLLMVTNWKLTFLSDLRSWEQALFFSFRVMTLLRPDDLIPLGFGRYIHAAESLLGPLLLGLLGLAVRQRLKR